MTSLTGDFAIGLLWWLPIEDDDRRVADHRDDGDVTRRRRRSRLERGRRCHQTPRRLSSPLQSEQKTSPQKGHFCSLVPTAQQETFFLPTLTAFTLNSYIVAGFKLSIRQVMSDTFLYLNLGLKEEAEAYVV